MGGCTKSSRSTIATSSRTSRRWKRTRPTEVCELRCQRTHQGVPRPPWFVTSLRAGAFSSLGLPTCPAIRGVNTLPTFVLGGLDGPQPALVVIDPFPVCMCRAVKCFSAHSACAYLAPLVVGGYLRLSEGPPRFAH